MKKLTLKWKLFLLTNYLLLVLVFFLLVGGTISLATVKYEISQIIPYSLCLVICLWIELNCILNASIVHRYFPDNPLSPKTRKLLRTSRIAMIVFTILIGAGFGIGFSAMFNPAEWRDLAGVAVFIYLGVVFLCCLHTTILQFQIPKYLNQQSSGSINQLIESIGK